MLDILC